MTYKLIQREPTPEMIRAAVESYESNEFTGPTSIFKTMWDAAPQVDGYKLPDQIALETATAIMAMYFEQIPGVQLKAKIQEAVSGAILAAQSQPAAQSTAQPDWKTFAAKVLQASRKNLSDVDGGDIQDWAVECGLLVAQMQTETCGEECRCAEYGMDLPWECFRYSPEAAEVVAALSQSAKEIKG